MCGIYGIWHLDGKPVDLSAVQAATTILRHRGPDDEGYLLINTQSGKTVHCGGKDTNPQLGLPNIGQFFGEHFDFVLGFRRLAILDLSTAGHQPMASTDRRFWIIHNGEVYNYLELRAELTGYGFRFHTGTDTEVILAAYQKWGQDCLSHLNGMWAFAIWQVEARKLFLARDRFGIKPLYYVDGNSRFCFASEIKALVGPHGIPFQPNDEVVFDYLAMGVLPSPQMGTTFYSGVKGMPASHYLTVTNHGRTLQRYWDIQPSGESGNLEPTRVVEEFGALFTDVVRLRLRADVPIGTCLSGGLDSSSIVGVVNRMMQHEHGISAARPGKHQKTFSAVYHADGTFNERQHIEVMAAHTGVHASFTFPTAERLLTDLERLIWHQDEPFPGVSIFAQWCVMHLASERGVTVLLDGQGADEILAGYRPFGVYLAEKIREGQFRQALLDAKDIRIATELSAWSMLCLSILSIMLQLPSKILIPLQRTFRQPLRIFAPLQRAFSVRKGETTQTCLNPSFVHAYKDRFYHRAIVLTDRSMSDFAYHAIFDSSLPYLLRYEDRNSMAFSIETRVPFLDYRLVDYTFGSAAPWRIHAGWTKWVLRKAMADVLPPAIAWRKDKVGFEMPEQDLLSKVGSVMRDRFTSESAVGKYLDANVVQSKLGLDVPFVDEARRRWRWVNLETWLRLGQYGGVS